MQRKIKEINVAEISLTQELSENLPTACLEISGTDPRKSSEQPLREKHPHKMVQSLEPLQAHV